MPPYFTVMEVTVEPVRFWPALLGLCVGWSKAGHETVMAMMTFQTVAWRFISMAGLSNETVSDDTGMALTYHT